MFELQSSRLHGSCCRLERRDQRALTGVVPWDRRLSARWVTMERSQLAS